MSASLRRKERSLLKIDLFRQFMRKCMLQKIMTVMSERAFSDAFLKRRELSFTLESDLPQQHSTLFISTP